MRFEFRIGKLLKRQKIKKRQTSDFVKLSRFLKFADSQFLRYFTVVFQEPASFPSRSKTRNQDVFYNQFSVKCHIYNINQHTKSKISLIVLFFAMKNCKLKLICIRKQYRKWCRNLLALVKIYLQE